MTKKHINYSTNFFGLFLAMAIFSWFGCYRDVDVRKLKCSNKSDQVCPDGYGCAIESGICCKLNSHGKPVCDSKTDAGARDSSADAILPISDGSQDVLHPVDGTAYLETGSRDGGRETLPDANTDLFQPDQPILLPDASTDLVSPDVSLTPDASLISDTTPDVPLPPIDGPLPPPVKLELGDGCKLNAECASGFCVQDVCCDQVCSGVCQGCNAVATGKRIGFCGNLSNGTTCGANQVCNAGTCGTCVESAPCTMSNPCKLGTTTCASGVSICVESGNAAQGISCGAATSCTAGVKTLAAQCNTNGQCVAGNVNCPSGCNASGTDCDADNCQPNPCLNLGTCKDGVGIFTCVCAKGWMGPTCAIRILEGVGFVTSFTKSSTVTAISRDGNVVVGYSVAESYTDTRAFKWSNGVLSPITMADSRSTEAHGLNSTGSIIVGLSYSNTYGAKLATVWQGATASTRLGREGGYASAAYGTNESGSIIVGALLADANTDDVMGARWVSDGSYEKMAMGAGVSRTPPFIHVKAVSGDASVVVGYCPEDPSGGFRWTAATGLLFLPDSDSAYGLTPNGTVAVGQTRNSGMAAKWTGLQNPVSLGIAGTGLAVNADATVIVGRSSNGAFIWDATNGARLLATVLTSVGADVTGWTLASAVAISDNGKIIAGNGSHNGVSEGWIARLP